MTELPKTFDPAAIEAHWYAHWEASGAFRPDRPDAAPFTIVMPPPNVTGSLHIGHALDITLQDILVRHARLTGKDALWVAGTDHAGIATQMVVERNLASQGIKRSDMTREAFVEHVWEWKAQSGGAITRQLRRLGASCDWDNERFTMDEGFSKAVVKVFVDLYNEGLVYRDKRLVNWDPGLKTAISDLEVETREVQGKFWHLRYPLSDGTGSISVATTRPETMLADMAVAVNPADERYTTLVGRMVRLPITGRLIPIVADEHADPALGSGAVKITPGHDFNDFEVGRRAGFKTGEMLNMLDAEARVVQTADALIPDDLLGLTVAEARQAVVARLEAEGALERVEDRVIQTPYGDRSGVVIEPWLTDQWYVDAKTLAGPAIEAVKSGAIRIVPATWEKTWFQWLENIQPWCVSRQLWWGHRIPAWYGPKIKIDGAVTTTLNSPTYFTDEALDAVEVFVAASEEEALTAATAAYRRIGLANVQAFADRDAASEAELAAVQRGEALIGLWRDNDVLDTWFSSALWPFGTLGWPDNAANPPRNGEGDREAMEGPLDTGVGSGGDAPPSRSARHLPVPGRSDLLAKHYPNDVLISGFDILFFWDARMAMQGLHFIGEAPWRTLYLHGLVRAPDGSKMSKSKGNTVDPLGLIERYGADALRFTLAAMESQGRDIKLDEKRVEGYRNFATKLWNAARFLQGNGVVASRSVTAPPAELAVNKWIIGEVVETLAKLDQAIADLRYDAMADAIYHFVWGTFCDWYIELVKGAFDDETKTVAGWAFDQILVMLHPFMPFITEDLWYAMGVRERDLVLAAWPEQVERVDQTALSEMRFLIALVSGIRSQRLDTGFRPIDVIPISVTSASTKKLAWLNKHEATVRRMARIRPAIVSVDRKPPTTSWSVEYVDQYELVDQVAQTGFVTAQFIVEDITLIAFTQGFIDLDAEAVRLKKLVDGAEKEASSLAARLANSAFIERAKPEAVEKARADHAEKSAEAERLRDALARLG